MQASAHEIVQAIGVAYVGRKERLSPAEVEKLMRPFAPISHSTWEEINRLLSMHGILKYDVGSWIEANFVVSGEQGPDLERRIQFLLMDTCTCVLEHLPKAIEHAEKNVDPRILGLMKR